MCYEPDIRVDLARLRLLRSKLGVLSRDDQMYCLYPSRLRAGGRLTLGCLGAWMRKNFSFIFYLIWLYRSRSFSQSSTNSLSFSSSMDYLPRSALIVPLSMSSLNTFLGAMKVELVEIRDLKSVLASWGSVCLAIQLYSDEDISMNHEGSLQDFEIQKKLGEGAFGQVFLVRRKLDNQVYALKKVKLLGMKDKEKDNALNEIRILASLNDEYIVKFKEAFFDSGSSYLCIVMEYAKGGDLMKLITNHAKTHTRIQEEQIWKAIVDILKGLKSLHDKKILHRDLKSANIFIGQEGKYKLGDLNVSKVLKKGLAYTQTGTPYYASPEVWQDLPYDMKSDIWSLGCVIYEMVALEPPFKASDLQGLFKKVKAGQYKPISSFYSTDLAEIVGMMLKVKPKDRLGSDQLLRHPIVKRKCGLQVSEAEMHNYYGSEHQVLLKTIKFNPYNLNSVKINLPKSSYGADEPTKRTREKRDSVDSLDLLHKDRALSACGIRSNNNQIQSAKDIYRPTPMVGNVQKPAGMNLPPRPQRKTEKTEESVPSGRDPGARLRRVGQEIVGRSSSVNR